MFYRIEINFNILKRNPRREGYKVCGHRAVFFHWETWLDHKCSNKITVSNTFSVLTRIEGFSYNYAIIHGVVNEAR